MVAMKFLPLLKNPFVAAILAAVIALAFTFIDSKITGEQVSRNKYIKVCTFVGVLVGVIVYLTCGCGGSGGMCGGSSVGNVDKFVVDGSSSGNGNSNSNVDKVTSKKSSSSKSGKHSRRSSGKHSGGSSGSRSHQNVTMEVSKADVHGGGGSDGSGGSVSGDDVFTDQPDF
jgi:hypothetical protein